MSYAIWLGRLVVFLLLGAVGYYLVAIVAGITLGPKLVAGEITLEEISSGPIAWIINTLAILGGGGLGYIAAFHRPAMRWVKARRKN